MATTISSLSQDPTHHGRLYIHITQVTDSTANITITEVPGSGASISSDTNNFEFHFNPLLNLRSPMNAFLFMSGIQETVENRTGPQIAAQIAAFAFYEFRNRGWASGVSMWVDLETNHVVLEEQRSEEEEERADDFLNDILGMSEREISMLKTEQLAGDEEGECSICLEGFLEGAVITQLSPCSHRFHHGCIVKWLRNNPTCPICRKRSTVPAS